MPLPIAGKHHIVPHAAAFAVTWPSLEDWTAFPLGIASGHTEVVADNSKEDGSGQPSPGDAASAPTPAQGKPPLDPSASHSEPPPATPTVTKTPGRWAIGVAAVLAFVVSLVLLVGDGLAGVLNNLGGAKPSAGTWLGIAAAGHGVLAIGSAILLAVGLASARRRRATVLAAWAIIPVGIGWLFLCGRLASG